MVQRIIKKLENYPGLMQFVKFCMVGAVGATFNYSIFFILYYFFKIHYSVAYAAGFISAIFLAFFLNKRFTFQIKGRGKTRQMIVKYFVVNMISFVLGFFVLRFLVEILGINPLIANVFTIAVTTASNFTGSKLFAFRVGE